MDKHPNAQVNPASLEAALLGHAPKPKPKHIATKPQSNKPSAPLTDRTAIKRASLECKPNRGAQPAPGGRSGLGPTVGGNGPFA